MFDKLLKLLLPLRRFCLFGIRGGIRHAGTVCARLERDAEAGQPGKPAAQRPKPPVTDSVSRRPRAGIHAPQAGQPSR